MTEYSHKGSIDTVWRRHTKVPLCMLDLVAAAAEYAAEAHKDQQRKVSGDPFFVHPSRVAEAVGKYVSPAAIAAAYLHDVIEDTDVRDLSMFPLRVRQLVQLLTRCPGESRSEMLRRIGKSADTEGILIKIADRIDNLMDGAATFGAKWLKSYVRETRLLLDQVKSNGLFDHPLARKLRSTVESVLASKEPNAGG